MSLKWTEFDQNSKQYLKDLRDENYMSDVTLATDDGLQIQAHRAILASQSNFLSDILMNYYNETNVWVYLQGISRNDLQNVMNFLYSGKIILSNLEMNSFLDIAHELKIKDKNIVVEHYSNELQPKMEFPGTELTKQILISESDAKIDVKEENLTTDLQLGYETTVETYQKENASNDKTLELDEQLEEIVEKIEGLWKCKICEKTYNRRSDVFRHAEKHVEGFIHLCSMCAKTFKTRECLLTHMRDIHSKLYSCAVCGKAGMNKKDVRNHKIKCDSIPVEQVTDN